MLACVKRILPPGVTQRKFSSVDEEVNQRRLGHR